jgi:hypothetical protein
MGCTDGSGARPGLWDEAYRPDAATYEVICTASASGG